MSEEKRAKADPASAPTAEELAQHASDSLKDQIAALRARVKNARHTLSQHVDRENGKKD